MRHALVAAVCLAGACGRVGFDGAVDAAPTTDATPFAPGASACTSASPEPLSELAVYPPDVAGFGVWVAPPNVLMADQGGGLHNLRFDGTAFTQVDHLRDIGYVEAVWSDERYAYISTPGAGFRVAEVDAAGAITVRAAVTANLLEARKGGIANDTLFVAAGYGLQAATFDGATISLVGARLPTMQWSQGAWADGTFVYLADSISLRVLAWDGATFADVVTPEQGHSGYSRIWKANDTLFVAHGTGVTAYRMAGTTLQTLATFPVASGVRDVWSDGVHVFVAGALEGVYVLRFADDAFTELDHVATGGTALGVVGDGTYLYVNDQDTGLHAYQGFACTAWRT